MINKYIVQVLIYKCKWNMSTLGISLYLGNEKLRERARELIYICIILALLLIRFLEAKMLTFI